MNKPIIIIAPVPRYQGNFLLYLPPAELDDAAEAEEEAELFIMIGSLLPPDSSTSTCFPHFGHTTQSVSIMLPQCLQYFDFVSLAIFILLKCIYLKLFVKALILNYINNFPVLEAVYRKILRAKNCSLSCCVFTRSFPDFHKLPRFCPLQFYIGCVILYKEHRFDIWKGCDIYGRTKTGVT